MEQNWKGYAAVGALVLALVLLIVTIVPVSYRNTLADRERFVEVAKNSCAVKVDNGIKAIVGLAQVDTNTKQFLLKMVDSASKSPESQTARQLDEAYVQVVETGSVQPFMLLMSTLSGTDITATSVNVQREISAQRSEMTACAIGLITAQNSVRNSLGWDAAGNTVKFPQTWMNLKPSVLPNPSLPDNDNDGRITVLDYRPPVDSNVMDSFNTGEAIPSTNPYEMP